MSSINERFNEIVNSLPLSPASKNQVRHLQGSLQDRVHVLATMIQTMASARTEKPEQVAAYKLSLAQLQKLESDIAKEAPPQMIKSAIDGILQQKVKYIEGLHNTVQVKKAQFLHRQPGKEFKANLSTIQESTLEPPLKKAGPKDTTISAKAAQADLELSPEALNAARFKKDSETLQRVKYLVSEYLTDIKNGNSAKTHIRTAEVALKDIVGPELKAQAQGYIDGAKAEGLRLETQQHSRQLNTERGYLKELERILEKGEKITSKVTLQMLKSGAESWYKEITSPELKAKRDHLWNAIQSLQIKEDTA